MPEETDKKLEYLKREEVRTMEKDIAKLREQESEITREKISQIRTGEETGKEAERLEQFEKAAKEREGVEIEAKRKEEELKTMRLEREKRAATAETLSAEEEEREKESLRAQFKEAQLKEEEERRRFLENVEAKAEGREVEERLTPPPIPQRPFPPSPPPIRPVPPPITPPIPSAPPLPKPAPPPEKQAPIRPPVAPVPPVPAPLPKPFPVETPPEIKIEPAPPIVPSIPPAPKKPFEFALPSFKIPRVKFPSIQLPKVQLPKVEGYFPKKPSVFEKVWIRVIISLFILALLTTIVTFWYWYLVVREEETITTPQEEIFIPPEQKPAEITKPPVVDRILAVGYIIPDEPRTIDTIIIHSVHDGLGGDPHSIEGIIKEHQSYKVTAHYLIDREGTIYQTSPDEARAYHAGIGQMPDGRAHVNDFSIGIELINTEEESPSETQYQSLAQLIKYLQKEYNIPIENILGHKDIAEGNRTDPWNFNMEYLKSLL